MALRILGTVIGAGVSTPGIVQITIATDSAVTPTGQLVLNAINAVDITDLPIGLSVPIYLALTGAEKTAIEAAVTVVPMTTQD